MGWQGLPARALWPQRLQKCFSETAEDVCEQVLSDRDSGGGHQKGGGGAQMKLNPVPEERQPCSLQVQQITKLKPPGGIWRELGDGCLWHLPPHPFPL